MKTDLLKLFNNHSGSEEEFVASIKELIDETFKTYTKALNDFKNSEIVQMKQEILLLKGDSDFKTKIEALEQELNY